MVRKTICHTKIKHRKAKMALLVAEKQKLKARGIIRDKQGHYIMIKMSVHQEDITIMNIHVQNKSFKILKAKIGKTK